jgi:hypothetical protein
MHCVPDVHEPVSVIVPLNPENEALFQFALEVGETLLEMATSLVPDKATVLVQLRAPFIVVVLE